MPLTWIENHQNSKWFLNSVLDTATRLWSQNPHARVGRTLLSAALEVGVEVEIDVDVGVAVEVDVEVASKIALEIDINIPANSRNSFSNPN